MLNRVPVRVAIKSHSYSTLTIIVASRVGHLRFTFQHTSTPYVVVEATRAAVVGHTDTSNTTLHVGSISIDPHAREICGSNPERQDSIIGPLSTPARGFSGYFCARFAQPFTSWGAATNGTIHVGVTRREDPLLSGFATFAPSTNFVDIRVGVSFISIEQARRNLDREIPDGETLEMTAQKTRAAWVEKLGRIQIEGATEKQKTIFYTAFFHSLQVCPISASRTSPAFKVLCPLSTPMRLARRADTIQGSTIKFMKANLTMVILYGCVRSYTLRAYALKSI